MRHRTTLLIGLFVLSIPACQRDVSEMKGRVALAEIKAAPAFSAVNYDGRTVSKDDLLGSVYIADFFFTSCGGPCPIMNSNANVLQAEFSSAKNFKIVSFTVDPATDTLPRMARYAERYGAKPDRWYFLRNDKQVVTELASKGFLMGDPANPMLHSTRFALVDRKGIIRGYFDGTDKAKVDELRAAIHMLLEQPS